jgi:hypothetical protein
MWRFVMRRTLLILFVLAFLVPASAGITAADEVKDRIAAFKKKMKTGEERDRIRAINDIATLPDKAVNKELKKVVGSDRSERVRAAAAQALGKLGNPKDLSFLIGSIRSLKKKPLALAGVVDAIGEFRSAKAVEPVFDVAKKWMTKHKYPAMAAIRAMGKIPSRKSIQYLIKLYELSIPRSAPGMDDGRTYHPPTAPAEETQARLQDYQPYIIKSLQKLTGELIADVEIWKEWWEDNQRSFNPADVKVDPNQSLRLVEDEFRYEISRPSMEWKWVEKPEKGFNRTAELDEEGAVLATLSIMSYSVWARTPTTAMEMAKKQKDFLTKEIAFVKEQKWDETVKMGKTDEAEGVDAVRQTIAGTWEDRNVKVKQTIFVHRGIMYLIRVTLLPGISHGGYKEADEFVESFKFLL